MLVSALFSADHGNLERSLDHLDAMNSCGSVAKANWNYVNLFSGGLPAFVDVAYGAP